MAQWKPFFLLVQKNIWRLWCHTFRGCCSEDLSVVVSSLRFVPARGTRYNMFTSGSATWCPLARTPASNLISTTIALPLLGLYSCGGHTHTLSLYIFNCIIAILPPSSSPVRSAGHGKAHGGAGSKLQFLRLRSATCESRSRSPPSSFSLKLCVIVLHTHRYHAPKFQPNPKHHDGILIFSHFARAAACCLLLAAAAKPGRFKTDYWDRAGSRMINTLMALDKVKSACK